MKLFIVGAELFHADGQTDMTKLTVAFRNLAYAPNNNGLLHLTDKTLFDLMFIGPCIIAIVEE